jgi:ribosomal protein S30
MGHGALDVLVRRASLAEAFSTRETPPSEIIALAIIGGSKKAIAFSFFSFVSFFTHFFFNLLFQLQHSTTGKVHGSLARAGKVRGQTPKVAKQDKKKLPKVREKRERARAFSFPFRRSRPL